MAPDERYLKTKQHKEGPMNEQLARLNLAEMIRASLKAKGLGEDLFDSEEWTCLISGEPHKLAVYAAMHAAETLGIHPQGLAELFLEAYPAPDFKPHFYTGKVSYKPYGWHYFAPDGTDPLMFVDAIVASKLGTQTRVYPHPYLAFGNPYRSYLWSGERANEKVWAFLNSRNICLEWMRVPIPLAERPEIADTPYWFRRIGEADILCTPDGAWSYPIWKSSIGV